MIKKPEFIPHSEHVNAMATSILFCNNLGKSVSSKKSIRDLNVSRSLGQANIQVHSNLSNGNLFIEDHVVSISDAGITLPLGLVYNSQSASPASSWRLNIGRSLVVNSANTITMTWDDGATVVFSSSDGIHFTAQTPMGNFNLIKNTDDGTYQLTQPGVGESAVFNASGFEQSRTNHVGATLTFKYDSINRITDIDLPSGRCIQYVYDSVSTTINLCDMDGSLQQHLMQYDMLNNNVTQSKIALTNFTNYVSTYQYNADGTLKSIQQTDQTNITFGYTRINNQPFINTITDGEDRSVSFTYSNGSSTWQLGTDASTAVTAALDANGRVNTLTKPITICNPDGSMTTSTESTTYAYTDGDRLQNVTYHNGSQNTFVYDSFTGLPATITDGLKDQTQCYYDQQSGTLIAISRAATVGGVAQTITEYLVYDDNRLLRYTISALGKVTQYQWNAEANAISSEFTQLQTAYPITNLSLNALPTLDQLDAWWSSCNTPNSFTIKTNSYDDYGRLNQQTKYAKVDDNGNPLETDAMQQTSWPERLCTGEWTTKVERQSSTLSSTTSRQLDGLLRETQRTDPVGRVTTRQFLDATQTISTTLPSGLVQSKSWDTSGLIVLETQTDGTTTQKTSYQRDSNTGAITTTTTPLGIWNSLYDQTGRLLQVTDANQLQRQYGYDDRNHLILRNGFVAGQTPINSQETILYDAANNPVFTIDADGFVVQKIYDASHQITSKITYATPLLPTDARVITSSNTIAALERSDDDREELYYKDADGHLVGQQDAGGFVCSYARNLAGWIKQENAYQTPQAQAANWAALLTGLSNIPEDEIDQTTYTNDLVNNHISIIDPEKNLTTFTWLGNGLWSQRQRSGDTENPATDIIDTRTFDAANRVTSQLEMPCNVTTNYEYDVYDNVSNTTVIDTAVSPNVVMRNETAKYDTWNRCVLTTGPRNGQSLQTTYDPTTGLKMKTTNSLNASHFFYWNTLKQLVAEVDARGFITQYTYDNFGNLLTKLLINTPLNATITGGLINPSVTALFIHYQNPAIDSLTKYKYNGRGLEINHTDSENYNTYTIWNAFSEKTQIIKDIVLGSATQQTTTMQVTCYPNGQPGIQRVTTQDPNALDYVTTETLNYQSLVQTRTLPSGNTENFDYDSKKRLLSHTDAGLNATESWQRDQLGRVTSSTNFLNHTTTTTYADSNRQRTITTALGNKTVIAQDALKRDTSVKDSAGNVTITGYNPGGDVISRQDPEHNITTFDCNSEGYLTATNYPGGLLSQSQKFDSSGFVANQYQTVGSTTYTDTFSRDARGLEIVHTNANFNKTNTTRDRRGLATQMATPLSSTNTNTIVKAYDGLRGMIGRTDQDATQAFKKNIINDVLGRPKTITLDPSGLALSTNQAFDSNNRVIQTEDANGNTCWHVYNAANQLCFDISATGIVKSYQYNELHKLSECLYQKQIDITKIPNNPLPSQITVLITAAPTEDTYVYYFYDAEEKPTYTITGLGIVTQIIYDSAGRKQGTCKYATQVNLSNLVLGDLNSVQLVTSSNDRFDLNIYNAAGKAQYHIDAMGMVIEYVLDANYNRTQIIRYAAPIQITSQSSWTPALIAAAVNPNDPKNRSVYQIFDGFNRLCYVIDENKYIVSFSYDAMGNQTDTYAYPTQLAAIPNSLNTATLASIVANEKNTSLIRHTKRQFDALNRKIQETDGAGYTQTWQQNALNQVTQRVDQGGYAWTNTHDNAGRKTTDSSPLTTIGDVSVANPESLTLNALVKDQLVKTDIFDNVGNITTHQEGTKTTPNGRQTTHTYDNDQRLLTTSYAAPVDQSNLNPTTPGSSVTAIETLTVEHVYNSAGKEQVRVDENRQPWFKVYDQDQRLIYEVQPNGAIRQYTRNNFGEAISITQYKNGINLTLSDYQTTGITLAQIQAAGVIVPNPALDRTTQFAYNANGQKTQVTLPNALMTWVDSGQLAWDSSAGPQTNWIFNTFGELIQTNQLIHGGTTPALSSELFWRDPKGQVIAKADADGYVILYTLDHDGKIVQQYESAYQFILANLPDDIDDLTPLVMQQKTSADRTYVFQRDVLGSEASKTLLTESVQTIMLNDATPPVPVVSSTQQNLTYSYTRDPRTQKIVQTTFPSGVTTKQEYDELARSSIKDDIPFHDRDTSLGSGIFYQPQSQIIYNAFNEPVANSTTFTASTSTTLPLPPIQTKTTLTLRDSRGLTAMIQDPVGNVKNISFNPTRHPARHWQWVSRFADSLSAPMVKQVKQKMLIYDVTGKEIQRHLINYDASVISTYTERNLFGEAIAEGDGTTNPLQLQRVFNNVGKVILENQSGGVARVHAYDGMTRETVTLQSADINLMPLPPLNPLVQSDSDVVTLLGQIGPDNKTTDIQRTMLERTPRGDITVQHRPKFTVQTPQTPEPYYTSFVVGTAYPTLGAISISWPAPQTLGLIGTLALWVHGQDPKTAITLTATIDPASNRMGVNVINPDGSDFVSDLYDYQLLLTYDPVANGGYQAGQYIANTYAASGTSLAIITPNTTGSKNIIMQMTNDNQLILGGNLNDPSGNNLPLTGVELWQNNQYIGKKAVNTQTNGTLLVDLSDQIMGTYQFKPIFKALIPIDAPVSIGQTTASGFTLSSFAPNVTGGMSISNQYGFNVAWSGMPAMATTIEIDWAYNQQDVSEPWMQGNYLEKNYTLSVASNSTTLYTNIRQGTVPINIPIKSGISLKDAAGAVAFLGVLNYIPKEYYGDVVTFSCQWQQKPYLYLMSKDASVWPDTVTVMSQPNQLLSSKPFLSQSQISDLSAVSNYETQQYQLAQLDQADANVVLSNPLFIRTEQWPNQIQCVELAIQNLSVECIKTDSEDHFARYILIPTFSESILIGPENPFQFTMNLVMGGGTSITETVMGGFSGVPLLANIDTDYYNFDFENIALALNLRGEYVTVYAQPPVVVSNTFSINSTTFYFSPLPAGVASATLQYQDTTLEIPCQFAWRQLTPTFTPSKQGLIIDVTSLDVGQYPYKLTLLDANGNVIQQVNDNFTVTHGNDVTPVLGQPEQFTVLAPSVSRIHDAWQNMTSQTDELQNTTSYEFNKRNKKTLTTNPAISVTDETGVVSTVSPTDLLSYDLDGRVIANTDANAHTTGHFRNEASAVVKTVRADGVLKNFIQDGFNRKITTQTEDGRQWNEVLNLNDQVLSSTDPIGNTHKSGYNEAKEQITQTTPNGFVSGNTPLQFTSGTNWDDRGNVEQTFNACEQTIKYQSDRNGQTTLIDDGGSPLNNGTVSLPVLYNRDYFGNLDTSQPWQIRDKSGALYVVTRDYNNLLLTKKSSGGNHGQYNIVNSSGQMVLVNVPDMNLQYIRDEAGNVLYILDDAMDLTTLYHYDAARNCIGERFKNAKGMIYQDTRIVLNARGWIAQVFDVIIQGVYTYDPIGNRRSTIVSVISPTGFTSIQTLQNWYIYNPAGLMVIDQGILQDGTIQITGGIPSLQQPPQGTLLGYDTMGRRITENTIDSNNKPHQKIIDYDKGDRVQSTTVDGKSDESYTFDPNGNRLSHSSVSANTSSKMGYDNSDRLSSQQDYSDHYFMTSLAQTEFSNYDSNNNPHTQTTYVPSQNNAQYHDVVTTNFIGFEQMIRSLVSGVRTGTGGSTPPTKIYNYNDANGNIVSVQGDLSGSDGFRLFVTNAEGRIVFNQNGIILQGNSEMGWYFYDPRTKQMIGRVSNLPPVVPPGMVNFSSQQPWTDVNFDLGYQAVDQNYPPAGPSTFTVPPDQSMTFADVSQTTFGDTSFGDEIALANNASSGSDIILPGQVVRIPLLSNTDSHNWQGDYGVYNQNAIVGTEYPNMPLPPMKRPHHSFWGELFEAVVGVFGIALDILTAGASWSFTEIMFSQLAINLETDALQQEIGMASGLQQGFSWDSLGEAGIGSLVGSGVNATLGPSSNAWTAAKNGATAFMQQAGRAEITTLFTQVFNRLLRLEKNIDWGQFITALADTLIEPNGKTNLGTKNVMSQIAQDMADTLVDDGIESLSQHQPLDPLDEAGKLLGTGIGDTFCLEGRDITNKSRENNTVDTIDASALLSNPFGQMISLPWANLDLTAADIYGPALQPNSHTSRVSSNTNNSNNTNNNASSNSITQQSLSNAEQAANQAATNTQNQLAQQRGMQNGIAANDNASNNWENSLAMYLYNNQSNPLDRAVIGFFGGVSNVLSSPTAVSIETVLANTAQLADSLNPVANLVEGITNRDLVTGTYVSPLQASLGITSSMLGMMGGDLLEATLPAARLIGSSIVGGVTVGLGRFGLFSGFGNGLELGTQVQQMNEAINLESRVAQINMYGSGPTSGVIAIYPNVISSKALTNYFPSTAMEYIYDPERNIFAIGQVNYADQLGISGSVHQQLARVIGADENFILGGTFLRDDNGNIILTENSGHYGSRWNSFPEARTQMLDLLNNNLDVNITMENWNEYNGASNDF